MVQGAERRNYRIISQELLRTSVNVEAASRVLNGSKPASVVSTVASTRFRLLKPVWKLKGPVD